MESLHIDTGAVSLSIDNDESRIITFYPTDVRFSEAFFDLAREFQSRQEEADAKFRKLRERGGSAAERSRAEFEILRDTYDFMREKVDEVFGPGTSQTVFGDHDSLGAYASFFRGLTPYVSKARKDELARYLVDGDAGSGTVMDV